MKILFLLFALSDIDASNMSKYLWGNDGWIKKAGKNFQVGCIQQGQRLVVSTSKESWEDAFAKVNLAINGPRTITAIARDAAGNIGESTVKVYVCNVSR